MSEETPFRGVPLMVRRLAADVMGVGIHRVRFRPERLQEISQLRLRSQIRRYVSRGEIYSQRHVGQTSRPTNRRIHYGTHNARVNSSREYVNRIRYLRNFLRANRGELSSRNYRRLYLSLKSGVLRNRRSLMMAISNSLGVTN